MFMIRTWRNCKWILYIEDIQKYCAIWHDLFFAFPIKEELNREGKKGKVRDFNFYSIWQANFLKIEGTIIPLLEAEIYPTLN